METSSSLKPRVCFEFEVEKIIGVSSDGNYQVQWSPSWVSRFHLTGCEHLIQEFLQQQLQAECQLAAPVSTCQSLSAPSDTSGITNKEIHSQELPWQPYEAVTEPEAELNYGGRHGTIGMEEKPQQPFEGMKEPEAELNSGGRDGTIGMEEKHGDQNVEIPCTQFEDQSLLQPLAVKIEVEMEKENVKTGTTTAIEHLSESVQVPVRKSVPIAEPVMVGDAHILTSAGNLPSSYDNCNPTQTQLQSDNNVLSDETNTAANPTCNKQSQQKRVNRSITAEKRHTCPTCGKKFNNKSNLNRHVRSHSGDRPHSCIVCDYTCANKFTLRTHMRTHTGEKPYSCDTCGKCFAAVGSLKEHIRTHTKEKPFACEYCGKKFTNKSHLNTHVRIHTGAQPYSCKDCGKMFTYSSLRNKHARTCSSTVAQKLVT